MWCIIYGDISANIRCFSLLKKGEWCSAFYLFRWLCRLQCLLAQYVASALYLLGSDGGWWGNFYFYF
jgi:hypothetical protein